MWEVCEAGRDMGDAENASAGFRFRAQTPENMKGEAN